MGKQIWLSRQFWFRENRPYVGPPIHGSRDEMSYFKHAPSRRVSAVNHTAIRTFREKETTQRGVFLSNFNFYFDVDNRERARARDKN